MSAASILAAGRRSAEALMSAQCRITRVKPITLDETTGLLSDTDPSDDVVLESSPCRIRSGLARVQTGDFEGQLLASQQLMLHLPVLTSAAVRVGDDVEIIDGGDDPTATGLHFRIEGLAEQTQATARRLPVTLLTPAVAS